MGTSANEYRDLLDGLRDQDWKVEQIGATHYKAVPPDRGKPIVHFALSTESRGWQNTLADLRKSGFVWPPSGKGSRERISGDGMPSDEEIAQERARRGALPDPPASSTAVTADGPEETPEQQMDRVYAELREATQYLALAEDHLDEKAQVLAAAQGAHDEASRERNQAKERLQEKRRIFNLVQDRAAAGSRGRAA